MLGNAFITLYKFAKYRISIKIDVIHRKKMKKIYLYMLAIVLTGCTSMYHIGGNLHDDGGVLHRPVPKKVKKEMQYFEEKVVLAIINADANSLISLSTPALSSQLKENILSNELETIKVKYNFNGKYKIRKIHNISYWADEMISLDPYKIYDFIACEYELNGERGAHAFLLISKKEDFKIWGFEIHKAEPGEKIPDLKYFAKEIKGWFTFH